jgi:hypothetical protein
MRGAPRLGFSHPRLRERGSAAPQPGTGARTTRHRRSETRGPELGDRPLQLRAGWSEVGPPSREPRSARVDWAELLKRTYDVDALTCPCGGRLRFISVTTERDVARAILESLGLPSDVPPIARARSPDPIDPIPDYG